MYDFNEIYKRIKQATNTRTQVELAEVLDIRQSSISDAKRRNSVPAEWYMKLFETFGLNPDWLKKGSGPMLLRSNEKYAPVAEAETVASNHFYESVAQYNEPEAKNAVVSVYSALLPYNPDDPATSVGKLNIPMSFAHPGIYVIKVEASSMEPAIKRGAYVGLDTTQSIVASGELYGVNLPYEGVVIKRVYLDAANNRYILRSESAGHPEVTLPISGANTIVGRVSWLLQKM
ncbi:helix-turn-helix domain-containing protein [Desulfovibrio sp. OttesenSCG-928-F07]|nr:helix-turn-helix domain-containing protein [Desulfovibrio sp. OttesenSCG-928-F07]